MLRQQFHMLICMLRGHVLLPQVDAAHRYWKCDGARSRYCANGFTSIPLAATFMARGVGYADWFPWQAGAALVAVALGGLGFKYVKEALDWQEE